MTLVTLDETTKQQHKAIKASTEHHEINVRHSFQNSFSSETGKHHEIAYSLLAYCNYSIE
jgi:hypothetical protein